MAWMAAGWKGAAVGLAEVLYDDGLATGSRGSRHADRDPKTEKIRQEKTE